MLLQRLAEYGRRLDDEDGAERLPPMYQLVPVRYIIKLNGDGQFMGWIDTATDEDRRGVVRVAPDRKRAYAIKPKLLCDNAEYTLGIAREDSKPERVLQQHTAYVQLVDMCAAVTDELTVTAVARFLDSYPVGELGLPDNFDPTGNISFDVDGVYPTDMADVQAFWARVASAAGKDAEVMQCLVCGNERPAAERLAVAIKGIPGGQQAGTALISANEDAFTSYGLEASLVAPTCEECGLLFGNALNRLLRDEDTHIRVADLAYVFWTREPVRIGWGTLITQAVPDDVRAFLRTPWRGNADAARLDTSPFYAATLSASNARIVVRDWIETTLGKGERNLQRYFQMQRLIDESGTERYCALWQLLRATVNANAQKETPAPQVGQVLMRVALHGDPAPEWLLYQAVRRTRSEQCVTAAHAALIKLVLLTQPTGTGEVSYVNEIDDLAALDMTRPETAYHCGRLLAELEAVQKAALGEVSATVVDRYFGTASSAPASVFGRLLRGAQPHLARLHRDKRGLWSIFDERLREITSHIEAFPLTLTLRDQGLFALGYYHQRTADGRARAERAQARGTRVAAEHGDMALDDQE